MCGLPSVDRHQYDVLFHLSCIYFLIRNVRIDTMEMPVIMIGGLFVFIESMMPDWNRAQFLESELSQ